MVHINIPANSDMLKDLRYEEKLTYLESRLGDPIADMLPTLKILVLLVPGRKHGRGRLEVRPYQDETAITTSLLMRYITKTPI